jgi:hypothetical protein
MPPENCCSTSWFAAVYNKLAGGGGGYCVFPSECPAHLIPAFCMFVFCFLSFLNLLSLPVKFLGRASTGRETEPHHLQPEAAIRSLIFWKCFSDRGEVLCDYHSCDRKDSQPHQQHSETKPSQPEWSLTLSPPERNV